VCRHHPACSFGIIQSHQLYVPSLWQRENGERYYEDVVVTMMRGGLFCSPC